MRDFDFALRLACLCEVIGKLCGASRTRRVSLAFATSAWMPFLSLGQKSSHCCPQLSAASFFSGVHSTYSNVSECDSLHPEQAAES
jgi:hypothetical protein